MRKWLVLIAFAALAGCQLPAPELLTDYNDIPVTTPEETNDWVITNIRVDSDLNLWGKTEYWAWPEETIERKMGDCDDMALLFSDICINKLGIDESSIQIVGIHLSSGLDHLMVRIDGEDFLNYGRTNYEVKHIYTWQEALDQAARTH